MKKYTIVKLEEGRKIKSAGMRFMMERWKYRLHRRP
jgi:hypothetical protein